MWFIEVLSDLEREDPEKSRYKKATSLLCLIKGRALWLIEVLSDLENGLVGFIGSCESFIPKTECLKSIISF